MSDRNCPFYGRHFVWWGQEYPPMALLDSKGNQCAIVVGSFAPCALEIKGEPVDWRKCPRVAELTPK